MTVSAEVDQHKSVQAGEPASRRVDLVVISDLHLGTIGCQAGPLLDYLKRVRPEKLVLNGDIIDCWQFHRYYWPSSHMAVLKRLMEIVASGTTVYYVTGNHDELLRKFAEQHLGEFHLVNKIVLELDGKRGWFFHGDAFDVVMKHSAWLARLGSIGYAMLILINRFVDWISRATGHGHISLSKKIKNGVKRAVSFIGDFEETAAKLAIEQGYDYVVCGHIHHPAMKTITVKEDSVLYLNSGDWVESLSALEYNRGKWSIHFAAGGR